MSAVRPFLVFVLALAAGYGALAWFDLVPGGWRLRTFVVPETVRSSRQRYHHRLGRLARFAAEQAPPGALVFLGSSTIERFDLLAHFPLVPTLNRGIGDEDLALLRSRLGASLPPDPAGAVLYAGSIDFRRYGQAPDLLAGRVAELIAELRDLRPGLPVTLLGLLPEVDFSPEQVASLVETNAALAQAAAGAGATFLATARPPVVLESGALNPAFAADRLHLSGAGYEHLADWLAETGALGPGSAGTSGESGSEER